MLSRRAMYKIVLVGDREVGKSSIAASFCDREFSSRYIQTIGIDFYRKQLMLDGQTVYVQIWDTAGDERFRNICLSCLKGASIVIIVLDLTSSTSLLNLENWIRSVRESILGNVVITIVANKTDLVPSNSQAELIANQYNASYFEVSAKNSENINQAFEKSLQDAFLQDASGSNAGENFTITTRNRLDKENQCC